MIRFDLTRRPQPGDWTEAQIATLRDMAGTAPDIEIAAVIGRSVGATRVKAAKLRISLAYFRPTPRPWSESEVAALRRMAATHTLAQAAAVLERSPVVVQQKANAKRISFIKHGEAHHNTKYPYRTLEQVFALAAQGRSHKEIAAELSVLQSSVSSYLTFRSRYRETMEIDWRQAATSEAQW